MSITPGPWEMGPDEFGNLMIYREENGQEIATIYPDGYENEEMRIGDEDWEDRMDADARLIVAAPEMVDLLDDALLELSLASGILEPNNGHIEALIERINKLFQRLKGEDDHA
jgi:hypothetical protein